MSQLPLVSVIIPSFRCPPETLKRAIDSVLQQTYDNIEIILVDDNGDENTTHRVKTQELMRFYQNITRIKYISHTHRKNGAAARNTGIRNARGEYIAFLDDDDEFLPEKIERQLKRLLDLGSEWGGVYCSYGIVQRGCTSIRESWSQGDLTRDILLMDGPIQAGSTLLVRRTVIDELEGFDESFERHQDWEFLIRFFRKYKLGLVGEVLVLLYREERRYQRSGEEVGRMKELFLSKFSSDIHRFPQKVQNDIMAKHWLVAANLYAIEGNVGQGVSLFKRAGCFRQLGPRQRVRFLRRLVGNIERDQGFLRQIGSIISNRSALLSVLRR